MKTTAPSASNSSSTLTSVFTFKRDLPSYDAEKQTVELGGIEQYFPEFTFPKGTRTFLYGNRNPALHYILDLELPSDLYSRTILDVRVHIGAWLRSKVGLDNISTTKMINLSNAKRDIADLAYSEVGLSIKEPIYKPRMVAQMHELPQFQHLNVICYTMEHEDVGAFQVATVFRLEAIDLDSIYGPNIEQVTFRHYYNTKGKL